MTAARIVALFLLFGTVWILVSDRAIGLFTQDIALLSTIQSFKGLLFVGLSALLLYVLVRRSERTRAALEAQAMQQRDHLADILNVNPAVLYSLRPAAPSGALAIDFVGQNVETVTGYPVAQWLSTPNLWTYRLHPDDLDRIHQAQRTLMATGSVRHEYRFRHADGHYRWINDSVVVVRDAAGAITNLTGAWLDVTDRRQAEERARLIAQVFESSQEGIFITDERARILSINRAFSRITGYALGEVLGKTPALLKSGRQDGAFYAAMWAQINAEGHWGGEIWNRRKSGEVYPEWLTINAIRDDQGQVRQYLGIFTETSSRKAAEERILHLANYDALTDLPNRALLADRARVALSTAGRQRTPLTVMHLNVDHFGRINESLGHEVGDQVLCEVALRLTGVLRTDDTVCRLGGDDFILLLPNTSARDSAQLSLRLMAAVAEPLNVMSNQVLHLTASVGVAEYPDNGSDLARLTQAAESAVHQAKREGRNTVRFFSLNLQEQIQDALALTRDLRWAQERGQLVLHYQPKVNAVTQRIVGAEALIRWQHPTRGLVPPSRFIPIAEESGLIQEIGTWVIRRALAQTAEWQAAGLPVVPVAVNLSVVQFRHPGLRDSLAEALRDSGLPAAMLELELTESVAMEDSTFTIATIAGLKQLGVTLSIDDFGTGYSSLSYLKRFAVDKLKIDQSFVRGLHHDPQDEAIVTTVISLARSLGLTTVGEGVETTEQRDFLRRNGCDELQGYLFSRPLPAEAFETLLRSSVGVAPCIA